MVTSVTGGVDDLGATWEESVVGEIAFAVVGSAAGRATFAFLVAWSLLWLDACAEVTLCEEIVTGCEVDRITTGSLERAGPTVAATALE